MSICAHAETNGERDGPAHSALALLSQCVLTRAMGAGYRIVLVEDVGELYPDRAYRFVLLYPSSYSRHLVQQSPSPAAAIFPL